MEPKTERLANLLVGFFLAKQAEGCSPNTVIEYKKSFAHFDRWCNGRDPTKLTSADLKAFLAHLRTQPNGHGGSLSAKTAYNAWAALRSFYRWLAEKAAVPNPMATVPAPKAPVPVIEPLSRSEVASILKACDGCREAKTRGRAAFVMRRDTALRDRANDQVRCPQIGPLQLDDSDRPRAKLAPLHAPFRSDEHRPRAPRPASPVACRS